MHKAPNDVQISGHMCVGTMWPVSSTCGHSCDVTSGARACIATPSSLA